MTVSVQELTGALLGGALIGLAALSLLVLSGRVAGISGIVGGLLPPTAGDVRWRIAFVAGLLVGGVVLLAAYPVAFPTVSASPTTLAIAGLLVGYGTRLGNGCTSGHGVCGIGRLSRRSLAATVTFIAAAMLTVGVTRHVVGGLS